MDQSFTFTFIAALVDRIPSRMHRGRRSRSPPQIDSQREVALGHQLAVGFEKIRRENRAGKSWRRRYKAACLKVLEHLQFLYQTLIQSTHPNSSRQVLQRAGQIDEAIRRCRADQLPKRSEPLLERLSAESDVDSEAVETVVLTSESETEPVEETGRSASGVWGSGRYTAVRVTANNPLLRSSSSSVPLPSSTSIRAPSRPTSSSAASSSQPVVLPRGVDIVPLPNSKVSARVVLSIDWHQVLDTVRFPGQVQRPRGYYLLPQIANKLQELKQLVPDIVVVVNSYCHCQEYRTGVLSIPEAVVDYRIVTDRKCGAGGKVDALLSIFEAERIIHIDDNTEVCSEFQQKIVSSRATDRPQFDIIGIVVPRRKHQRQLQIDWRKNVIEAVSAHFNLD